MTTMMLLLQLIDAVAVAVAVADADAVAVAAAVVVGVVVVIVVVVEFYSYIIIIVAAPGARPPLYPCKGCIAFPWIAFSPSRGHRSPIPVVCCCDPFLVVISSFFVSFLSS